MTKGIRPLIDKQSIEHFLIDSLELNKSKGFDDLVNKILNAEIGIIHNIKNQTLDTPNVRNSAYRADNERWQLRSQIVNNLITKQRLSDDNKITLRKGGALPQTAIQANGEAVILIGLPASGKSTIASNFADKLGAVILDSDFAKRMLPEFNSGGHGANIVHEESSEIIFGFNNIPQNIQIEPLYKKCIDNNYNIIIPKIGHAPQGIINQCIALNNLEYKVHLVLVHLPKQVATLRALNRFKKSNRYVPLNVIFDYYSNNPILSYYFIKAQYSNLFVSMGAISTFEIDISCIDSLGATPALQYPTIEFPLNRINH